MPQRGRLCARPRASHANAAARAPPRLDGMRAQRLQLLAVLAQRRVRLWIACGLAAIAAVALLRPHAHWLAATSGALARWRQTAVPPQQDRLYGPPLRPRPLDDGACIFDPAAYSRCRRSHPLAVESDPRPSYGPGHPGRSVLPLRPRVWSCFRFVRLPGPVAPRFVGTDRHLRVTR